MIKVRFKMPLAGSEALPGAEAPLLKAARPPGLAASAEHRSRERRELRGRRLAVQERVGARVRPAVPREAWAARAKPVQAGPVLAAARAELRVPPAVRARVVALAGA